jgi:ABC-2 type transport system ATP-binding protein
MAILQVKHLTKRYGRVTALNDVSFSVRSGEILGLIGPNGSGKTTLFECLAGVLPADGGAMLYNGQPLDASARASVLFYLPDAITPWPSQSVGWALDFAQGFFNTGVRPRAERALALTPGDVVALFDLEPILHEAIGMLSKGQRKRVLLALSFLMPQGVLLADEPFEGLDLRQTRDVAAALLERAAGEHTLVLSIHQIAYAPRMCDRFVLLSSGHVCGEGTLDELSSAAASRGAPPRPRDLEEVFLALT